MTYKLSTSLLLLLLFTGTTIASTYIDVVYQTSNKSLQVKQCFDPAPKYVYVKDKKTTAITSQLSWNEQPLRYARGYANIPGHAAGCLQYNLQPSNKNKRFNAQHPEALLLAVDEWLWYSNKEQPLPQIRIKHDSGIQVSAPWQLINRTANQTTYQMKPSPRYANGFLAIGPMESRNIHLGASRLRLAIMSGTNASKGDMIEQWVTQMAGSVAHIGDSFPLKDIQVLVVMMSGSGGAVPWGQVNRAGGQGVLLVVNPNKTRRQLFSDWTAAHEFSHLLMPYTPDDRWLAEGFASYHQNISRMRVGMLDEPTAWRKLIAGFERGQKSASKQSAPILKQADRRHNMQMYWGGAVIALKADVTLQLKSRGAMNLSKALAGLQDCCLDTGKSWRAQSLFRELDRISGTDVFSTLYEQEVKRNSFPEYQSLLHDLGIKKNYYGGIRFDDSAPYAKIRQRISQGS